LLRRMRRRGAEVLGLLVWVGMEFWEAMEFWASMRVGFEVEDGVGLT
jgi:hypothetical protein